MKKRPPLGWTIAGILLGLYFLLKLQGWWFGFQSGQLRRELENLRPTLTQIHLRHELEKTAQACSRAFDLIQQLDFQGSQLLTLLSKEVAPSVTLQELRVDSTGPLKVRGTLEAGIRSPEETLIFWARRIQPLWQSIRITRFSEDTQSPGLWRFDMEVGETPHA
ncbi:MAG: hypothetical protein HYZ90_07465 [Candidatus Omnitrophica bacterium]|nr:hypothetical protein [Candidatus Omnitrophota bacterium]